MFRDYRSAEVHGATQSPYYHQSLRYVDSVMAARAGSLIGSIYSWSDLGVGTQTSTH